MNWWALSSRHKDLEAHAHTQTLKQEHAYLLTFKMICLYIYVCVYITYVYVCVFVTAKRSYWWLCAYTLLVYCLLTQIYSLFQRQPATRNHWTSISGRRRQLGRGVSRRNTAPDFDASAQVSVIFFNQRASDCAVFFFFSANTHILLPGWLHLWRIKCTVRKSKRAAALGSHTRVYMS